MSALKPLIFALAAMLLLIEPTVRAGSLSPDAVGSMKADMATAQAAISGLFSDTSHLPFSFRYGDAGSSTLLRDWHEVNTRTVIDRHRTRTARTFTDPKSGLVVDCDEVAYSDFPEVEWVVTFKNAGMADTPIIANINALDWEAALPGSGDDAIFYSTGSRAAADDYEPHLTTIAPGTAIHLGVDGGRSSERDLPFFDVRGPGGGVVVGLGWPGNWRATVTGGAGGQCTITAGQGVTHFLLHPGESARTPMMVLQWYRGSLVRGQNVWRRWMLAYNTPHEPGALPEPILGTGAPELETLHYNEAAEIAAIDQATKRSLPMNVWWIDAGWYPHTGSWANTGTWDEDRAQFPDGLRRVTDHARAAGMQQVLWFEPERAVAGTAIDTTHPEWLISLPDHPSRLYNLANADARAYLTEMIGDRVEKYGVDIYRQDFNMDPLDYWRSLDTYDRQGITENHYVTGLLQFWDDLRTRFPKLRIDTCASGGRRNDLEILRRAVPLLQSDYRFEPLGTQGHQYGIAAWIPYHGTGGPEQVKTDLIYNYRSYMCPCHGIAPNFADNIIDWPVLMRLMKQEQQIQTYYFGDYYPLTPYSLSDSVWIAWQYDRPDLHSGIIQAFRRPGCADARHVFPVLGLETKATYEIDDMDSGATANRTGADLMQNGLPIELDTKPGAALISYREVARGRREK